MRRRCVPTVHSLIASCAATCLLHAPAATSSTIWVSRRVSSEKPGRADGSGKATEAGTAGTWERPGGDALVDDMRFTNGTRFFAAKPRHCKRVLVSVPSWATS